MHVVFWGTYDTGKARTRIVREALLHAGVTVTEIHTPVWDGVDDKAMISGAVAKLKFSLKLIAAYPLLIWRYLRAPAHDAVFVGYMGHFDVIVLWLFAVLRGKPVVWDAFLSLYDTVVCDRGMFSPKHPAAMTLKAIEWTACLAASKVVLDTKAHAELFAQLYGVNDHKLNAVFVGAEEDHFSPAQADPEQSNENIKVLFYGQFIPLHGIETIIRAAQNSQGAPVEWTLIGRGQETEKIHQLLNENPCANLNWRPWVPYEELRRWIAQSDLCLGVFGNSEKAGRVIPNKVFQILCAGKPLITRDGPGVRELLSPATPGVYLVPAADPAALNNAVACFTEDRPALAQIGSALHADIRKRFSLTTLSADWLAVFENLLSEETAATTPNPNGNISA